MKFHFDDGYSAAVVDGIREEKTAAFRFFCWEQFRSYEVEWKYTTAAAQLFFWFQKVFPYANTFMARVKHRKKTKHTRAHTPTQTKA